MFHHLPAEFVARLIPIFPYYDAFILLHTLPPRDMRAVLEKMKPIERSNFIDELPEENWQQIIGGFRARAWSQSKRRKLAGFLPRHGRLSRRAKSRRHLRGPEAVKFR